MNEAHHGLGSKKKWPQTSSFVGYIRISETAGVLKCHGRNYLTSVDRPLIPKFEFLLKLRETATQKLSYNRHVAAEVLPAHQQSITIIH